MDDIYISFLISNDKKFAACKPFYKLNKCDTASNSWVLTK